MSERHFKHNKSQQRNKRAAGTAEVSRAVQSQRDNQRMFLPGSLNILNPSLQ